MRSTVVIVAGIVMLLSSLAHAFAGWPAMRAALGETGAPADLTAALAAGWTFGSVAMATFGVVVVLCGLRLRRGDRSGVATVRVVAAAWFLFGVATFVLRDFNPHFLLFVATGILAGGPVLTRRSPT